jgi:hypothetical protein
VVPFIFFEFSIGALPISDQVGLYTSKNIFKKVLTLLKVLDIIIYVARDCGLLKWRNWQTHRT